MNRSYIDSLYRRCLEDLRRLAFSILRHREDAEDVVQDVFVELLEGEADHLAPGMEVESFVTAEVIRLSRERRPDLDPEADRIRPLRMPTRRPRRKAA